VSVSIHGPAPCVWTLLQAAHARPRPRPDHDELILHADGWLCEIKDTQIRDGLHILGEAPHGSARVNPVLAMLRARQMWAGQAAALPGLREALGHIEATRDRTDTDAAESTARALVEVRATTPASLPHRISADQRRHPRRGSPHRSAGSADHLDIDREAGRIARGLDLRWHCGRRGAGWPRRREARLAGSPGQEETTGHAHGQHPLPVSRPRQNTAIEGDR
jgi:cobalamin biosynthesis Mg chelatase CobN